MRYSKHLAALMLSVSLIGVFTNAQAQLSTRRLVPDQTQPIDAANPDAAPLAQLAAGVSHLTDGSFTGPAVDAYFGLVQVQANIKGGRIVSIDTLQYPDHRRTSRAINDEALPILEQEVVSAQNTRVSAVSGATLTSRAYLRSLGDALRKAGN